MVFVQSTGMSEFEFIECNAIHVPVQCRLNTAIGAWLMLNRLDLVHCLHVFGLFNSELVCFGA
jgi:hypothetical protein